MVSTYELVSNTIAYVSAARAVLAYFGISNEWSTCVSLYLAILDDGKPDKRCSQSGGHNAIREFPPKKA